MTDFSPKEIFLKERLVSLEGNNPPSPLKEIQTDIDYDPKTRQDRFGNRYYFSPDNKSFLDLGEAKRAMLMVTKYGKDILRQYPRFLRILNNLLREIEKPSGLGKMPESFIIEIDNKKYKMTRMKEEGSQSTGFLMEIQDDEKTEKFFVKVRRRMKDPITGEDISQPYFYETLQIQLAYEELKAEMMQKQLRFPKIFLATS